MSVIERFSFLSRGNLRAALAAGHPIDPDALAGFEYKGISLGLPPWVESLSWKVFRKTFHRDAQTGGVRGWNVRMAQPKGADLLAEVAPLQKGGKPWTFGHYRVVPAKGQRLPGPFGQGLLIDYGLPGGGVFRLMRDPLVALEKGSTEVLLGWSYVELGFARVGTPSYFLLVREGPVSFVPELPSFAPSDDEA